MKLHSYGYAAVVAVVTVVAAVVAVVVAVVAVVVVAAVVATAVHLPVYVHASPQYCDVSGSYAEDLHHK